MAPTQRPPKVNSFAESLKGRIMMCLKSIHPAIVTLSTDKSPNKDIGVIFYSEYYWVTICGGSGFLNTTEQPYEIYETKIKVTLQNGKSVEASLQYFDVENNFTALKVSKLDFEGVNFPTANLYSSMELHRDQHAICVDMDSDGHYEKSTSILRDAEMDKMNGECGAYVHCESNKEGPGVLISPDGSMIALKMKKCPQKNLVHALPFDKLFHMYMVGQSIHRMPKRPESPLFDGDKTVEVLL